MFSQLRKNLVLSKKVYFKPNRPRSYTSLRLQPGGGLDCPARCSRWTQTSYIILLRQLVYAGEIEFISSLEEKPLYQSLILKLRIKLMFEIRWKLGGHISGHIFWITLFSKKYFTMNTIHDIPETNGSHSQPLYRALKQKSSKKYKFLTDLYSAEKTWRVFFKR